MTIDFEAKKDTNTPLPKRSQWQQVNEVTWKLASTLDFTNTPASHGKWAGSRSGRALGWVMNVGTGVGAPGHRAWLARCRDRSIGPTTIGKAKAAALVMVSDPGMGRRIANPISHLNALQVLLAETAP